MYVTARNGSAPDRSFVLRGRYLRRGYFVTDGIYPKWSTFVKAYPHPVDPKDKVRDRTVIHHEPRNITYHII